MQIPSMPRQGVNSISMALKQREVWSTIPQEWQLYFNSILQPFEFVDRNVFLQSPTTVFVDTWKAAGFRPIDKTESHQIAQYMASLVVNAQPVASSVASGNSGQTTPITASSLNPNDRLPHEFVKDFSEALNTLGNYGLNNIVLPKMSLNGNGSSNEVIAEYILVNGLFDAFVHACVSLQPTNWGNAKRYLPIRWSDGSFSNWTARRLEKRLRGWSLNDLRVLTSMVDLTEDKVGERDTASLYASQLVDYCLTRHLLTKLLESAAEMLPTPLHW